LYKEDRGSSVNENGGSGPMDCIVDPNEFIVEMKSVVCSECLKNAVSSESDLNCPMLVEKVKG
ncbi:hypothetical protein BDF14DRAFT_1719873, partial [Spinellus fusiger]